MENIEDLFTPTGTRLLRGEHHDEVQLTGSLDDLRLHSDCTWDWLCAFAKGKIVRISPGVFISTNYLTRSEADGYRNCLKIEMRQGVSTVSIFVVEIVETRRTTKNKWPPPATLSFS
jgi:hypothetical protein